MQLPYKRLQDSLKPKKFLRKTEKYVYAETFFLITVFLIIGYFVNPEDICLLEDQVPYLLVLLSVITLFHGFESGMFALGIIATSMWFFYESFPYVAFLVNLLMVMIFSEFYYFWTNQIKELKANNTYKTTKLTELANAFYTLKISHDQLEKNYVLKPMSIRSAIEEILYGKKSANKTQEDYFKDFLSLLEKSFDLQGGFILYPEKDPQEYLMEENIKICYSSLSGKYEMGEIFQEYIVNKAINYKRAVYVSDINGSPALRKEEEDSKFLAAIPIIYEENTLALLVIERMSFMAFNKENLISLSILFEYLLISSLKKRLLKDKKQLLFIDNTEFRYEYIRTSLLQEKYGIHSTVMVFKIKNQIQALKLFEKSQKMLRSLDLLTQYQHNEVYNLIFLFPMSDKASAIGFLNRLQSTLHDERDKKFEHMLFAIQEESLLQTYIQDNYHD